MKKYIRLAVVALAAAVALPADTTWARPSGGGGGRSGGGSARAGGGGGSFRGGGGGSMRMGGSGGGFRTGGSAPRVSGGAPRMGGSAPRISSGGAPRMSSGGGVRVGGGVPGSVRSGGGSAARGAPAVGSSASRAAGGVSPRINTNVNRGSAAAIARPADGSGRPSLGPSSGAQARGAGSGRAGSAARAADSDATKGGTVRGNTQLRSQSGPRTGDVAGAKTRGEAGRGNAAVDRQVTRASANRPQVDRINEMLGTRGRGEGSGRGSGPGAGRGPGDTQFVSRRASWSENVRSTQLDRVRTNLGRANQSPVRPAASTRNWLSSNPQRAKYWNDWGQNVRSHWNHHHYHGYFTPNWWALNNVFFPWRHSYYWWGARPWTYWWGWPTWGGLCNWYGGWGWNNPCYYDYGYGGNVVYVDRYVYVNGQPVASAADYALSAAELAATEPSPAIAERPGEWLALGTFAIATSKEETDPARVVQLAVDKEGNVSGTMVNKTTNKTYPVQGHVDKETQRVAFTIGDNKDVVLETGIYNLTQEETPVLVHQGTDRTETYVMLRVEAPKEEAKQSGDKGNLLP